MNDQQIELKTVNELRVDGSGNSLRFFIPNYQRGFRWSPLQVKHLLNDIHEFTQRRNPQADEFYCLQPLVIKARLHDEGFEVVDGQQRLTTLLLIMRHFNERLAERYRQTLFRLDYQTRPSLDAFLANPTEEEANDNVDFYHLYDAIKSIDAWFSEHESEVETIKAALLNQTKIIWFQLADLDDPVDAFTRLNVGKIPLTNDELIRALFLRRSGSEEDATSLQLRIAYEWDQLEKALQSDAFWYFLSNEPGKGENRIGFIFDLVARDDSIIQNPEGDAYRTFHEFNRILRQPRAIVEDEWGRIKRLYLLLEEWFQDRVLYHMVGFLVCQGMSINEIRALSENCTKSAFRQRLRNKIFKDTFKEDMPDRKILRDYIDEHLEKLSYVTHRPKIKGLLLLFNLATILRNRQSNIKFQFNSFKSEQWDIEHIRSVTDDRPGRYDNRRRWLQHSLDYLTSKGAEECLQEAIQSFLKNPQPSSSDDPFDQLYDRVLEFFKESKDEEVNHNIANLTLLDAFTNRSYKNAVFAVKRKRVLELDQFGTFVPLCTRNVFLKCHSPQVDNVMFWGQVDRDAYFKDIVDVLTDFFTGNMGDNL